MCGAVFVTYNRHNSSRKGFREKDPGYVGIRANKDLWWDLCAESNISFEVLFHLSASKRKRGRYGKGRIDAEPSLFCLSPVSYLRFFENAWSPSKRQISNRHACTLTL